nr:MAG TPA: hypothetical protein [Caudoviricetes sp.]
MAANRLMNQSAGKASDNAGAPKLMSDPKPKGKVFDLAAWVQGRGTATRNVRVWGDLDAFGEREKLGADLEAARALKDTALVKDLKAQIDALTVQMLGDYQDFTLRALTDSKRMELIEELQDTDLDPTVSALTMLSHYVEQPEGVTTEGLVAMAEWDPVQTNKLIQAMNELNSLVPNIEGSRPF